MISLFEHQRGLWYGKGLLQDGLKVCKLVQVYYVGDAGDAGGV